MPIQERSSLPTKRGIGPQWILFTLVLGVLILSSVAFAMPIGQSTPLPAVSETPSATEDPVAGNVITITPSTEADALPPTAEEIGYTDGIIFCSTVLVLILLVGTLRETVRRKRHEGDTNG